MRCVFLAAVGGVSLLSSGVSWAADPLFSQYYLTGSTVTRPAAESTDALADGRLLTLSGNALYIQSAVGLSTFTLGGTINGLTIPSYGSAFLKVSPDGTKVAIGGNSVPSLIGVLDISTLNGGTLAATTFTVDHTDAEWVSNVSLAITSFGKVSILDTSNAANTAKTVVSNIGGYSAGVTVDVAGNLYTGNGYDLGATAGLSETGWVKRFTAASIAAAMSGGSPVDFENGGTLVADLLSASSLHFDGDGNLLVGGGDYFGSGDSGYIAVVSADALLEGKPVVSASSPVEDLRKFTGPGFAVDGNTVIYDPANNRIYVSRYGVTTLQVIAIPEPSLLMGTIAPLAILMRRRTR